MSSQPLAVSSGVGVWGEANGPFHEGDDRRDESGTPNDAVLRLMDIGQRRGDMVAKGRDRELEPVPLLTSCVMRDKRVSLSVSRVLIYKKAGHGAYSAQLSRRSEQSCQMSHCVSPAQGKPSNVN